jgi:Dicarboxylate transport
MKARHVIGLIVGGIAVLLLILWVARARLAAELARQYFQSHGIAASVAIDRLGLSGVSGRFALGPASGPTVSAEKIELRFDPLQLVPRVVEVRLVHPEIRAEIAADGAVSLPELQDWIASLGKSRGQSRFVSPDLAVSLSGLRAFLQSPYGRLELDGDLTLRRNLPVTAAFTVKPAAISYRDMRVTVREARLSFDNAAGQLSLHFAGDLDGSDIAARNIGADLTAAGFGWDFAKGQIALKARSLQLHVVSGSALMGVAVQSPTLDLVAHNLALSGTSGNWQGQADFRLGAGTDFAPDAIKFPALGDAALTRAVAANAKHLDLSLNGHVADRGGEIALSLSEPATLQGAAGGLLQVSQLAVQGKADGWAGSAKAKLAGKGLPDVALSLPEFHWSEGAFIGRAALNARFGYAMLRRAALSVTGDLKSDGGNWRFDPASCATLSLAAFHAGASDMAKNVKARACPAAGKPLFSYGSGGWRMIARARDVSADLPLANVHLADAEAALDFAAKPGASPAGTVVLTAARLSDRAASPRFNPVLGTGRIQFARNVWRGTLSVSDPEKQHLGDVTFTHRMANGAGSAQIAAPHLNFAVGKLEPATLSPLLAAFRRAEGSADFEGTVSWTGSRIASGGRLHIAGLNFLTPLGQAHDVKTDLEFTSLLPPTTKSGQALSISRIDWTLPFTGVNLHFGFSTSSVRVDGIQGNFADGHVTLGPFTINPANPGKIDGTLDVSAVSLAALVTASNLGSKIRLEGKVSGHVPFSAGPGGVRILNGHVEANGAGRLSIDPSLWTQGGATSTNAVQGFAYQAMEHLAFDQLNASLNSIAGGRLQVIFHIRGKSAPPKPQQAEVGLMDLINGTALQKPIPLPSGTPIELTLDTSLNFDELLKSYSAAWAKTLSPGAAD